jgi:hypothetical protein
MPPERRPNPDRSAESLEARLRALPPPAVPAGLESRLLAAIPPARPIPRRRGVWVSVIGAVAAACLLALLAGQGRDIRRQVPGPKREITHQSTPRSTEDDRLAAWRENQRLGEGGESATFAWPLPETPPVGASNSIPSDLFD